MPVVLSERRLGVLVSDLAQLLETPASSRRQAMDSVMGPSGPSENELHTLGVQKQCDVFAAANVVKSFLLDHYGYSWPIWSWLCAGDSGLGAR